MNSLLPRLTVSAFALSMVFTLGACSNETRDSGSKAEPTAAVPPVAPTLPLPLPAEPLPETAAPAPSVIAKLAIDASDKVAFQYYALVDGVLVKALETDPWIFGVRRYIFRTHTGSNGAFVGGAYEQKDPGFEAFSSCDAKKFVSDEVKTVLGYTISANEILTNWYDYAEDGSIKPLETFYAIGRDSDCLKIKITSYTAGLYEIEYSQVK